MKLLGLTVSLGRNEVLYQTAPHRNAPESTIFADGTQLKNLKYPGSITSALLVLSAIYISLYESPLQPLCNP